MFRIAIKPSYTMDYANIRFTPDRLSGAKATPSALTANDLLKLRNRQIFEESKPLMLTAHSMEQDLFASAMGSGISIVSEGMNILTPYDDVGGYDLTDSQFIHNFTLKESFYRDQIAASYSGEELKAKLEELDAISGKVIDGLAGKFASGIGAFFNGTQDWLSDGRPSPSGSTNSYFDVNAFKANVLNMVKQSGAALEGIKRENPEKWSEMLETGGANGQFFIEALDETAGSMGEGSAAGIENMEYGDVVSVSRAIGAMGKGIYTNSSAALAAYLGQEKLKSVLAAGHFAMSGGVREAFLSAVDRNIQTKVASFKSRWLRGVDDPLQEVRFNAEFDAMYQSFAGLSGEDADGFRTGYANGLKMLYDRLTEREGTPESPKANQIAMAKGFLETLVQGWSGFLDGIGESNGGYSIPGIMGNLVDVEL